MWRRWPEALSQFSSSGWFGSSVTTASWSIGLVSSGVVAGVLGVVHAFGELHPALVRRGDELHENGGALDDVEPALLKRVKNFWFRGCVRRPVGDPPGPRVPPYAAPPLRESPADKKGKEECSLLPTSNI